MHSAIQFEDRVSRSRSKHEGESSAEVCDRLSRTREVSQRQLPTDHDHAVPTREYQLDQSSPLPATAAADPALEVQKQKPPHPCAAIDRVTPYQFRLSHRMAHLCQAFTLSGPHSTKAIRLEDVAAQIVIPHDRRDHLLHVFIGNEKDLLRAGGGHALRDKAAASRLPSGSSLTTPPPAPHPAHAAPHPAPGSSHLRAPAP